MPNTQATDFMNVEMLIEAKVRDFRTPLGDFLSGKGWVRSPTVMQTNPFIAKVGIQQYVAVTFSANGLIAFALTSSVSTSENLIRGDEMLSNAPTVNVQPGMRVELTGTPTSAILRSRTGTVVREDIYDDYVIVALDTPALYRETNGEVRDLPEIAVMVDNLRILSA